MEIYLGPSPSSLFRRVRSPPSECAIARRERQRDRMDGLGRVIDHALAWLSVAYVERPRVQRVRGRPPARPFWRRLHSALDSAPAKRAGGVKGTYLEYQRSAPACATRWLRSPRKLHSRDCGTHTTSASRTLSPSLVCSRIHVSPIRSTLARSRAGTRLARTAAHPAGRQTDGRAAARTLACCARERGRGGGSPPPPPPELSRPHPVGRAHPTVRGGRTDRRPLQRPQAERGAAALFPSDRAAREHRREGARPRLARGSIQRPLAPLCSSLSLSLSLSFSVPICCSLRFMRFILTKSGFFDR